VHVLALRDCTPLVSVGIVDMLRKANDLAQSMPDGRARSSLKIMLVAPGRTRMVTMAGGIAVKCGATIAEVRRSDLVVVPAIDPDVLAHLALNREVVPWLRRVYARGADLATVCTGAFLVAEAGLLDHRTATTHWAFQPMFAARYPRVHLEPQAIVVDQGRVCTAGGATSFLNLALFLVERLLGASVARAASQMFLVDVNKSPQGAYAMLSTQKMHGDEDILRVQEFIERDPSSARTVDDLARRAAMSRRSFVRRFTAATGNAPRTYVQRARIEVAKRALESGRDPIGAIAARCGYADLAAFRRIFVRFTGLAPADYRARYGPRSRPAHVARKGHRL
jgi:transcriptional regulator GlxA family with amidase domain